MPFTVVFSDSGEVLKVFSVDKISPGDGTNEVPKMGIEDLASRLNNQIVLDTNSVLILQTFDTASASGDPCIIQGGQLWCWP
jgi:hypothetical protein